MNRRVNVSEGKKGVNSCVNPTARRDCVNSRVNVSSGKKGVNSCVSATTVRDCMNSRVDVSEGKKGVSVSDGRGCVNHQKIACTECCALLAFKYIAACEDVVEFQRKVREVMKRR